MKVLLASAILMSSFAAPAMAWDGQVVACYNKVWVPAKYEAHKHLVMAAHTEWQHKNGQMVQVHYPAVYKESKKKVADGYYIARKAPCVSN